jgi:hypothetical protein
MTDKGSGGYPSDVTDEEWAFVRRICCFAAKTARNASMS